MPSVHFEIPVVCETFTHRDNDNVVRHFNIPLLKYLIQHNPKDWKLITLPIGRHDANFILKNHGVEKARLKAYPLSKLDEPGIACVFPDESILIVDGNHRLIKRVNRGLKTMDFWAASEDVWKHGVLKD